MRSPCLGINHLTISIQAFTRRGVDVKMTLLAVNQDALFSRYGIDVAALARPGIRTARDQSNVYRVLVDFLHGFSDKLPRFN
jgi:hypothetical protein